MKNSFTTKKFPAVRKASVDLLNAASRKNMIHAFAEADITDVRRAIRNVRKSSGGYLSLIGYIQFCAAKAVGKQKQIQAYRDFRNRLVIFDDVDISTTIERKIGGTSEVLPTIIRCANRKSMFEISGEIKDAKEREIDGSEVFKSIKTYLAIPGFIRRFAFRLLDRSPKLMKKKAGTIMVTSANAGSSGMLWGVPVASHTLNITIGGIKKKPVKKGDSIEEREFLCLTVSVDHDIVDGAPAARFIRRFLRVIETEIKNYKL
ncbi:MAG: 2-oxo acid dehydrogenase subunit E2 [Bacteroidales bacterium]|nr:2-oxo acid dehydrogenase subunit E2 [Bacteroidales bacterium]MCF8377550.1 2-oxo acid dehydrogenase subunit E2 [Bacteroidales bacterium]MCF8401784.1 2-oxo acid dehydrogenase subunit E2 [Bacteroidales bacterium]